MKVIVNELFTKAGAKKLHQVLRDKYKCDMIEDPKYNPKTHLWEVTYRNTK